LEKQWAEREQLDEEGFTTAECLLQDLARSLNSLHKNLECSQEEFRTEAVAALETKDAVDVGVDPIDEITEPSVYQPGETADTESMLQELSDSLNRLSKNITYTQEDLERERHILEKELAAEEKCTVDMGVDPISEIQEIPMNVCDPHAVEETEVRVQQLAACLKSLSEELARIQAEDEGQREMMHAALEAVAEDSDRLLEPDLTETEGKIQQLASTLENLLTGLANCQQGIDEHKMREAVLDKALRQSADVMDMDIEQRATSALDEGELEQQELGHGPIPAERTRKLQLDVGKVDKSADKGNQVLLALFWQLLKESFQVVHGSEGAFVPEEVFNWIAVEDSGKITREEFQDLAAALRMPLDCDTMCHIYDLVASNAKGLIQADFVQTFGNLVLRDGLELLSWPR